MDMFSCHRISSGSLLELNHDNNLRKDRFHCIQYNTVVVVVINSYSDPERSEVFSFFFGTNYIILQNITS